MDKCFAQPGEYFLTDGPQPVHRSDTVLTPVTLPGLVNFCSVRKAEILARASESFVTFNSNDGKAEAKLVLGEHGGFLDRDEYEEGAGGQFTKLASNYIPSMTVDGSAMFSQDHKDVKSMMGRKWKTQELGRHIQAHKHLFSDNEHWNKLVGQLRSMTLQINTVTEDTEKQTGEKNKVLKQQIESAPVIEINMFYPIFQGEPSSDVKLFVAWDVEGATAMITLLSDNIIKQERDEAEKLVERTRASLKEILGDALPFINMN